MQRNKIGLAGEFRVMSELLMRGFNPAKSYLEDGADIILNDNGLRIEVKSSHRCHIMDKQRDVEKGYKWRKAYLFSLKGGARKRQSTNSYDILIAWCIDDDCFFVIPSSVITAESIGLVDISDNGRGKYIPYKNRWDLLNEVKK